MRNVVIRRAVIEDLQAVQDLNHTLFVSDSQHYADLNTDWPYSAVGEKYFRDRIAGTAGVCLVAEQVGKVIGYVAGGWSSLPAEAYTGTRAELENICVAAEARDHGVGAKLVEALFMWAKAEGADHIMVNAYTPNEGALNFYRQQGFGDYSTTLWHKF